MGFFAHPALAPAEYLLFGNTRQVAIPAGGTLFAAVYSFVIAHAMVKIINAFCPFRIAKDGKKGGSPIETER